MHSNSPSLDAADITAVPVNPPGLIVDIAALVMEREWSGGLPVYLWPLAAGIAAGFLSKHGIRMFPWIPFRGYGHTIILDDRLVN